MNTAVRVVQPDEAALVVDALCEAFHDYPVIRYVLGTRAPYDGRLRTLVGFFVAARTLRNEVLLGIGTRDRLDAAAMVSRPDGGGAPAALLALRDRVWTELGDEERGRYSAFGRACAPFDPGVPHLHLNMIGVRPGSQGTGLSRRLLEHVHDLSASDSRSSGVSLTTENEANVPFYRRFGYELVGEAVVAPELRTWGFYRAD